jgi:O-methyltransferase involved in polyketide biosynthesis
MTTEDPWAWARVRSDEQRVPVKIDTSRSHPARSYDYLLGGKDNYEVDRQFAEAMLEISPNARERVREARAFLRRVVRFLAGEAGIRQFLDIGAGLPTQGNVHEVAQRVAPEARVVYVDNDPIVLVHARALLAVSDRTMAIQSDLREPDAILRRATMEGGIDFEQPVAILLMAILHFITDEQDATGIVARLRDALAPGSYLALSHVCSESDPKTSQVADLFRDATAPMVPRSRAQIEQFFYGMELVDPGVVKVYHWRPDVSSSGQSWSYGGVARKN